jgi:linoleoyl-CoA desaturase
MKTIKFTSEDPNQKEFVLELKKQVAAYFKDNKISIKGDFRMILKAIIMLSMYLFPFLAMLIFEPNVFLLILLVIIMGIGEAGIGMSVMHDAAHGAFSNKKWVNSLFASTMFLLGSNTYNWKIQHNLLHHTFTNIYGYDQDIESKATLRLCEHAPLHKIHRFQYLYAYFFYGFMTLAKLITDIGQLIEFNRQGITKKQGHNPVAEIMKLIVTKLIYFSVLIGLPLLITDYRWYQVVIGFCILHLTAGMIMSTIFQMAHVVQGAQQPLPDKNGAIPNEWEVHQLLTTSDFARNNHFLNWYVGGLNFQIEHHLFSNTCHRHYRKIAPIVEKVAREYGMEYNLKSSFTRAFRSHARRLKELGTDLKTN